MEQLSPSAIRISAALRALRQVYADNATDKAVLGMKCLEAVMSELAADGVPADDLQPLRDLESIIGGQSSERLGSCGAANVPSQAFIERKRDRRRKAAPSNALLARSAAMIDLLVKDGQGEDGAAQTVMRHLLLAGVPAPAQGGDSRGWRRLLSFRNTLHQGSGPADARVEYAAFGRELAAIPAAERVETALQERLWDRRRQARRDTD